MRRFTICLLLILTEFLPPAPGFAEVTIRLRPSRLWLAVVLLSSLYLLLTAVHWLVLLLVPLAGWHALRADGWFCGPDRLPGLNIRRFRDLYLQETGQALPVTVLAGTVVLPWLIVLQGVRAGRRFHLVLFPDSAPADAQRRLRVYLRWSVPGLNSAGVRNVCK